jgi:hypothetical protein
LSRKLLAFKHNGPADCERSRTIIRCRRSLHRAKRRVAVPRFFAIPIAIVTDRRQ